MGHPYMELNLRLVRQLGGRILQKWQRAGIVASLEQDPTEGIGHVGLVRREFLRPFRVFVSDVRPAKIFGIENRKIVYRRDEVGGDGEYRFVRIARRGETFQPAVREREQHQGRNSLLFFNERRELFDRLFVPV